MALGRAQAPFGKEPGQGGARGRGLPQTERVQGGLVLSLQPALAVPRRFPVADEEETPRRRRQGPPSFAAMSGAAGFFMPTTW